MRTRSNVRSEIIEHAASNEDGKENRKRKRKDDDSVLDNAGERSKRCKIQSCAKSMATQVTSSPGKQRVSYGEGPCASSSSKDDDDEMILGKFVGALRKRRAANRSPLNATGEKSCASLTNVIAKKHGMKGSHTHILADPHVRENHRVRNNKKLADRADVGNATVPQGKTKQGQHNGFFPCLGKRSKKQLPRSGKLKSCPGNIKRFTKESIGSLTLTDVSQKSISSYSCRRLNGAKSRWKNLAWSIYRNTLLGADERHVLGRIHEKEHKQQPSLLKLMKTWLMEAKFAQSVTDAGENFIMSEADRHAFAQSMVRSCRENPNMRTVFLESVRMLTLSGVMQMAASNLLQQGPCDEANNVMNAWADFKEQSSTKKALPMNLLTALNELHEKRGDLSIKLTTPNVSGMCTLSQIDEQTWKFQVPRSASGG